MQAYRYWKLIIAIVMSCSLAHAAAVLSPVERAEVHDRWQQIFMQQLSLIEQDLAFVANDEELHDVLWLLQRAAVLADRLLAIDDQNDVAIALNIVAVCEEDDLWEKFLIAQDQATAYAYLIYITSKLSAYVAPDIQLKWPPQLHELDAAIAQSGLDERVFMVRVRQAFLAFTLAVSKLSMLLAAAQSV